MSLQQHSTWNDTEPPEAQAVPHGFIHPAFAALESHWSALRCGNDIPHASALSPAPLARWLPDMSIVEVVSPTHIQYRLVGTRVTERLGFNPTGENLVDFVEPDRRNLAGELFTGITAHPCGARLSHLNIAKCGRQNLVLSIFYPLITPEGVAPRVVGMHALDEVRHYGEPCSRATLAAQTNHFSWIDVGYGIPNWPDAAF